MQPRAQTVAPDDGGRRCGSGGRGTPRSGRTPTNPPASLGGGRNKAPTQVRMRCQKSAGAHGQTQAHGVVFWDGCAAIDRPPSVDYLRSWARPKRERSAPIANAEEVPRPPPHVLPAISATPLTNVNKGGTPRAPARAQTGGTPVPEQGDSRPQWAPEAMGGAAKRKQAERGAAKAT